MCRFGAAAAAGRAGLSKAAGCTQGGRWRAVNLDVRHKSRLWGNEGLQAHADPAHFSCRGHALLLQSPSSAGSHTAQQIIICRRSGLQTPPNMPALVAVAAPRALPGLPAQQLVSLRSFCPQARPQARRGRSCHPPPAAAAAAEELLLGARPLVLPTVPIPEADQLPPFQEWHNHPELLTG